MDQMSTSRNSINNLTIQKEAKEKLNNELKLSSIKDSSHQPYISVQPLR